MARTVSQGEDGFWRISGQPDTQYYPSQAVARRVAANLDGADLVPGSDAAEAAQSAGVEHAIGKASLTVTAANLPPIDEWTAGSGRVALKNFAAALPAKARFLAATVTIKTWFTNPATDSFGIDGIGYGAYGDPTARLFGTTSDHYFHLTNDGEVPSSDPGAPAQNIPGVVGEPMDAITPRVFIMGPNPIAVPTVGEMTIDLYYLKG